MTIVLIVSIVWAILSVLCFGLNVLHHEANELIISLIVSILILPIIVFIGLYMLCDVLEKFCSRLLGKDLRYKKIILGENKK